MNTVLVTGATGSLGRAVVTTLCAKGLKVKAAARNLAKAAFPAGVEAVKFDYQASGTFEAALKSVEGLFLLAPPLDPDAPAKLNPVIDKAKATGVKHIVFISAFGVDAVEQAPAPHRKALDGLRHQLHHPTPELLHGEFLHRLSGTDG
jgi:uncharacterized protein YbjT (DUF2867 family)